MGEKNARIFTPGFLCAGSNQACVMAALILKLLVHLQDHSIFELFLNGFCFFTLPGFVLPLAVLPQSLCILPIHTLISDIPWGC